MIAGATSGLRAARWALVECRRARRQVRTGGLDALALRDPPVTRSSSAHAVAAALTLSRANCLERAAVRQRWHAARGDARAIVVGVRSPSEEFGAHAWLEGDEASGADDGFAELVRRAP